ncbi:MAG: S8 family serine peptidase [candidate division WOR-3 bacterium]
MSKKSLVLMLVTILLARANWEADFAPNRFVVKFRSEIQASVFGGIVRTGIGEIDRLNADWGITGISAVFPEPVNQLAKEMGLNRVYLLSAEQPIDIQSAVGQYASLDVVEYAEPDFCGRALAPAPNDPNYGEQWGFKNIGQLVGGRGDPGTPGCDIDAELAWDIERGSRDIIIGNLDSGADIDHEEFVTNYQAGVLWHNWAEIPANNVDDDSNGYIDDTLGWNFEDSTQAHPNGTNNVDDNNGHGTHTTGTIAAHTNNNTGGAGTCWYGQVMAVKVINAQGRFWYSHLCKGIYYAVNNGARILNMSLGGTQYSPTLEAAVNYAWNSGVLPVAAMGNDTLNDDSTKFYPAGFANVIAVGATANDDERMVKNHNGSWMYSMWGSWIDVAAPGNNIYSTVRNNGYDWWWGTSMAAPHVSGTAALLLSRNPDLSPSELKDIIQRTAEDLGAPGFDVYFGHGRINAYQALQEVEFLPGWIAETLLVSGYEACFEPDIAVAGENVHLVYSDKGGGGRERGLYYLRSTNGGRNWERPRLLSSYQGSLSDWHPRVAVLGNRVALVFHDSRGGYYGVYFKQSTDNGQNWGNDLLVSDSTMESYRADVCFASDTIHLVWNCGYRRSTNGGANWDTITTGVSGQAIAASNNRVFVAGHLSSAGSYQVVVRRYNGTSWEPLRALDTNYTCFPNPDVAADGNNVYVVWDEERDSDGISEEIALRKSTDGGANWGKHQHIANVGENYTYRNPRIAAGNNRVNLVWWGDRDKCWSCEVYYKRSTNAGLNWGNTYRLCYNGDNEMDEMPAIGFFADTVHVVWDQVASGTKSVYYIRKGAGQPGAVGELLPKPEFALRLSPNPVLGQARMRLTLPESEPIRLRLFDVSGRVRECPVKITSKVNSTELWFDCTKIPAGVYLLEIKAGGNQARQKITVQH